MDNHNFILRLHGCDVFEGDVLDILYAGGCDDASFGKRGDVQFAEFDREATSRLDAILSAIDDVESAVPALRAYLDM